MAITKQDVLTTLAPIIVSVPDEGIENIVLSKEDGIMINADVFVSLFANATDMTALSLNAIDNGKLGYSDYITEWQSEGYIQ